MTLLAAVFTTVAILVIRPTGTSLARWRLGGAISRSFRLSRLPSLVSVGAMGLLLTVAGSPSFVIAGSTVIGALWFWWRLHNAARKAATRRDRSSEVAEIVDALAAELGAGILPHQAVERLSDDMHLLGGAATASRLGGNVGGALRTASLQPGAESLSELAAAWEVSERSGAPMARVLDRLGDGIRADREVQREILIGLGPARATARLMAVLPLFGLGMGVSMGADPVGVILHTIPGAVCLAAGTALACAGVAWVDRIAVRAERS